MKLERAFSLILEHCCVKCLGNSHHLWRGLGSAWRGPYSRWVLFQGRVRAASTMSLELSDSWHHHLSPRTLWSASLHCQPRSRLWPLPPLPSCTGYFCDGRIHLSLKCEIFLGVRDIWSSRETVWTFLHPCRNFVQASNFPVPFKISRYEHSIGLNSPKGIELMLYSGNFYSSNLKICVFVFPKNTFFFLASVRMGFLLKWLPAAGVVHKTWFMHLIYGHCTYIKY